MSFLKYMSMFIVIFFLASCSSTDKKEPKEKVIPKKITMLFVVQPECPSCDKLEKVMSQEAPKKLIESYFDVKKVYLGEKIPENLVPPEGTPTIYFLGSDNKVLVEPLIGEKSETELMEFLDDAIYEFKAVYGVDIKELNKENNETNKTNEINASKNTL